MTGGDAAVVLWRDGGALRTSDGGKWRPRTKTEWRGDARTEGFATLLTFSPLSDPDGIIVTPDFGLGTGVFPSIQPAVGLAWIRIWLAGCSPHWALGSGEQEWRQPCVTVVSAGQICTRDTTMQEGGGNAQQGRSGVLVGWF